MDQDNADRMRWLDRYGDDYDTDAAREAGYQDYVRNRAEIRGAFGIDASS